MSETTLAWAAPAAGAGARQATHLLLRRLLVLLLLVCLLLRL